MKIVLSVELFCTLTTCLTVQDLEATMTTQELGTQDEQAPDVDETDIAHLAGVIDAAGTVTVHVTKNDRYSIGYQYSAVVELSRPANDDDPLIGKLLAYCDEYGVRYKLSEGFNDDEGGNSKSYRWVCNSPDNIERFLKPMLPFLVTEYESAVIMMEQIIPRMKDDLHTEKGGFYELMEFADVVRGSNPRRKRSDPKYNQDYFAETWSVSQ